MASDATAKAAAAPKEKSDAGSNELKITPQLVVGLLVGLGCVPLAVLDEKVIAESFAPSSSATFAATKEAFIFAGDIGDPKTSEALVGKTIERFGKLDVVVNNAAEQHAQDDIADISEEQLTRTFKTNIFGAFHLLKAARPHLKSGASIILVTSVTAYRGQPLLIDYSSTKGALLSLIRALSGNLASENIRVNGVAPGPIWTPLIPASFPEEKVETFGKDTPLGRPGQPNEVAPSLLFLACEDSSYISGQVLHPNGGELVGG